MHNAPKKMFIKLPSWLETETIEELLRLVPHPLIKSKRPFKGYEKSTLANCISSNITAGEYYPVEASVFQDIFWSQYFDLITKTFDLNSSDLISVRCQLNCIPFNARYHPLSIAPHADSISSDVDVIAVNIPLVSTCPFLTAFWSHKTWGNGLNIVECANANNSMNTLDISGPFAASDLLSILDDNPDYTTSFDLFLRNWTFLELVETKLGQLSAYNGRMFHSPYLASQDAVIERPIEALSNIRISLAIFAIFSRKNSALYPAYVCDDWLSTTVLNHSIKTSMLQLDGTYSTYRL